MGHWNATNIRKARAAYQACGERLDSRILLSGVTAIVTTTLDLSTIGGTLRDAILAVDSSTGTPNSIVFKIPKSDPGYNPSTGAFTISPLTELPQITNPVLIDGTTESSFLGEPALVVIDGNQIKGSADGLTVAPSAPGSTIDGLEIASFDGSGIVIESANNTVGGTASNTGNILVSNTTAGVSIAPSGQVPGAASHNLILGNLIGTDSSGASLGNGVGIIIDSPNNTVGGSTSAGANVIGFNNSAGVEITGTNAIDNFLLGNFIGTNASGANMGSPVGVVLGSGGNTIGGSFSGAGNVIGLSTAEGIEITGAGATNEVVLGNLIGTNANGANLGNVVGLLDSAGGNTIGGTTAGAANIFGFNTTAGMQIGGTNEVVIGNLFGTNVSGANLGNVAGLLLESGSNTIGGSSAGTANVFGFNNSAGVAITGAGATANVVLGNFIGTNSSAADLSNRIGVVLNNAGADNTIGGSSGGTANVFGFNTTAGLQISVSPDLSGGITNDTVIGNLFGTDASGAKLGNTLGVLLDSVGGNTIGGASTGAANVFGFNTTAGLKITVNSGRVTVLERNTVIGNLFGTDASGENLGNTVGILDDWGGNTIGGTSAGASNVFGFNSTAGLQIDLGGDVVIGNLFGTNPSDVNMGNAVGVLDNSGSNTIGGNSAGAANVFGFNSAAGFEIARAGATNDVVIGNLFGTNASRADLGNAVGVNVTGSGNTIGGTTSGAANVFGFNTTAALLITGTGATANVVLGNFFGSDAKGANLANSIGLLLGSSGNTIGGATPGAANIFGFNTSSGLDTTGAGATANLILGNLFGTNPSGANLGNAVGLNIGSAANTVGGSAPGAGNTFAFNNSAGVVIAGTDATGNVLLGNLIGTNSSGANLGNATGVVIGSAANTIGGSTSGSGNLISQNETAGIDFTGSGASANVVLGNLIGTDSTGQLALGNDIGVLIGGGTANVIGGMASGAANVISGNLTAGIEITGATVSGTQITGNRIGTNASGTSPVVRANQPPLSALQNTGVVIIGSTGNVIGGTSPLAGNLISGNYVGVTLATIAGADNPNQVAGNLIGTDASGVNALGNIVGIYINGAAGNQIGMPGSPNTVSGNSSVGVEIYGNGSTANVLEANIIGLASDGTTALRKPNGQFVQPTGVFILNASRNTIGGLTGAQGNVISGNQNAAVYIFSQAGVSSGNTVQHNLVGLASSGSAGPGNNGYGVLFLNAPNNQAGVTGPTANRFGRNRIATFRSLTGPALAVQAKTAQGRARHSARTQHFRTRKLSH